MLDPLITPATSLATKLAVEAYKGRNRSTVDKLNHSDTWKLEELVVWSEHAVKDLQCMQHDFLDAIRRQQSMTTSSMFQSWTAEMSTTALSVSALIGDCRNGKEQPILLPQFITKNKEKKITKLLVHKITLERLLDLGLLFNQNKDFFLVPQRPEPVIKITNVPQLTGFPSLAKPFEQALRLLESSKERTFAFYGSFGVGKTSVLRNLNNCKEVAELFDMVIFLDGSAVESDANLLQAIASRIKLPHDVQITAETISQALRTYNKCLLLCDDVRTELSTLSLEARTEVSTSSSQLEMPPGSKVVLTARSEFIRICHLIVDIPIPMPTCLTPNEAWHMFQKVVGEDAIRKPGVRKEARKVCELCGCIPFVIRTVAKNFTKMDRAAFWRTELRKMTKEKKHKMKGVEEIYNYWKSCYNQLKDNMANCFLYAALHPAGRKIHTQHLIESWTEEGLIDSNAESMTRCEMLDEGQEVLRKLTDLAFLEKQDESMMFVEMNGSIHEFAMHVHTQGGPDGQVIVKTGAAESPTTEDWTKQAKRISMVNNNVRELPAETTGCENLLTLLLKENSNLTTIPSSFFRYMNKLVLLDLYKTGIAELPSSVSFLVALKALYLNDCNQLTVLPMEIKKLESLEVWALVKLKCLRTSYTGTPPPNQKEVKDLRVVSWLQILEELAIYVKSYHNWCNEAEHIIRLVAGMKSLTNLKFCFPSAETVETFLADCRDVFGNLNSFHFYVGCENKYRLEHDNLVQYLRYCDGENDGTDAIKCIVANSQALELVGHKDIIRLSDMGAESFKSVYDCVIESCDKMETVSDGHVDIGEMLPYLQKLHLRSLQSLKVVVAEAKELSDFWGLQVLELKDCPNLTKIVSQKVLEKLHKLKTLVVENCEKIEVLIPQPKGSKLQVLPELQTLRLLNLPKLRTVCTDESVCWPSLEVLEINKCPTLKGLPIRDDRASKLCVYEGEQLQKWMATPKK